MTPARRTGHKRKRPRRRRVTLTAATADRYELYERSVQIPEFDIHFITRIFRKERERVPMSLREDFCGTGYFSAEWVRSRAGRTAIGVDISAQPLDWGRRRHVPTLGDRARRLRLIQADVLDVRTRRMDAIAAFNYSYCVFHTRPDLLQYFTNARQALVRDGCLLVDVSAGPEALEPTTEERRLRRFVYIWEQKPVDAITGKGVRYIHFEFHDGSRLRRAFKYEWRIWSIPELCDTLQEAGYSRIEVYEGDDAYRRVKRLTWDGALLPIIVAWR
jgi:SAM-dependent methyltransferase